MEEEAQTEHHFGTKFKRTLDSDEEDDEVDAEKYNVLDTEQIEGTEKATVDFDGDIKITPFNMDEELETGHFDKEGTYILDKQNDIHDNWLDNIDWTKVKGGNEARQDGDGNDEAGDDNNIDIDQLYRQLLQLILPSESIQRGIQRYGKSIKRVKKGNKWKKSKGDTNSKQEDNQDNDEDKEKMMQLISLADRIQTETGDMQIYDKTYEDIQLRVNKTQNKHEASDMFAEDFHEQSTGSSSQALSSDTLWEYKWEDKDEAQIYGPFTSEQMLGWTTEGHFHSGIFVRKKGSQDAKFYTSKRIDFELYV